MNKLICIILFLALISCKTEKDAEGSSENAVDTTAFQQKLKFEDQNLALEPQAREYALNWAEYIIAQNEVNKLHNSTLNEVMHNAGAIAQIMQSLKNSVPDSLRGVAVEARLNVINTKAQLLKQYSARQDPDEEDIRETTGELHQEFNNFKLQMNEVFLKTLEEFEKELDEFERMEREMDSL